MPDVRFAPCFRRIFEPAPYKVFRGGRGGGRSWAVARALLLIGLERPIRILCARETQKSIRESVHKLLVDQIARMGLQAHYHVQHVAITGNREWPGIQGKPKRTEFIFAGISDQTAASIKSFEDVDFCWVEEAQTVSDNSWMILLPTLFRSRSQDERGSRYGSPSIQSWIPIQRGSASSGILLKALCSLRATGGTTLGSRQN